jgi:hypothetical protein
MATRKKKAPSAPQLNASSSGKAAKTQNGSVIHEAAVTMAATPTMAEIRLRAYHLYLERGATHGQDQNDWFIAEKLLSESPAKRA